MWHLWGKCTCSTDVLYPILVLKWTNALLLCVFQYYPIEEVLAAEYLLEDFRPDLIEMVLDKLRPEHVRSVDKHQCLVMYGETQAVFVSLC